MRLRAAIEAETVPVVEKAVTVIKVDAMVPTESAILINGDVQGFSVEPVPVVIAKTLSKAQQMIADRKEKARLAAEQSSLAVVAVTFNPFGDTKEKVVAHPFGNSPAQSSSASSAFNPFGNDNVTVAANTFDSPVIPVVDSRAAAQERMRQRIIAQEKAREALEEEVSKISWIP